MIEKVVFPRQHFTATGLPMVIVILEILITAMLPVARQD
jgi:hypothetical protein